MKEQYYGETIARAVMFSNDIDRVIKQLKNLLPKLDVDMAELVEVICETFLSYAQASFISNNGKSNIYMYLNYIGRSDILDEDAKAEHRHYYQTLMDMLNGDATNRCLTDFYRIELATRKQSKRYYNRALVPSDRIDSLVQKTNDSIEGDLSVLYGHLDLEDSVYAKKQVDFVISPTFIESARYLTYEYPGLVAERNFKNRLCSTLQTKEDYSRFYRKNVFRRMVLNKENAHLGKITFTRADKKLYKQVAGM